MGQLIEYGSRIQKIGIDKFDCAQGVVVKAMLINYSRPYARNLAFDEIHKCSVECTEEMALKYGLKPRPRYFFLVAAFQQDMQGNILGDTESKVTYMSMSNGQYEHFLAQSNNLDKWNGFVTLTKVQQKGKDGRDMSYIEATPASSNATGFKGLPKALIARIAELVKDEELLKTSITMIDAVTGLYEDKYIERINQSRPESSEPTAVGGTAQAAQLPQASQSPQVSQPAIGESYDNTASIEEVEVSPTDDLPF